MHLSRIYIFLAILLFTACEQQEGLIEFETVTVDKTVALSNDKVPPTCSITLKLQQATAASGHAGELINATVMRQLLYREDDQMQTAAESFAEDHTERYRKTLLPLYNADRADTARRAWYHYHYIINSSTRPGSKGTTVYLADINYQEGGDHVVNQTVAFNFENKTGRLLSLDDIFVKGYESQLNKVLLRELMIKTQLSSLSALQSVGYLRTTGIYPPANFILGEEAITFVYNPDEIAPYTVGATELTISYTDLEKILKTTFIY